MTAETNTTAARSEAARIYAALFNQRMPQILVQRFDSVNERLNDAASPAEREEYYRVLGRVRDLEALEMAARYRRRLPLLSRKFRAMAYLAETRPDHQRFFVNDRSSWLLGMAQLGWGAFTSALKVIKGLWLLRGSHD